MRNLNKISSFALIVAIGFLTAFIFALAQWTAPTFTPPSCPTGTPGCDIPLNTGSATQTKTGGLNITKLQLGDKWLLSGVGDIHGNDDWLRLFNSSGNDYYGGFATNRLWVKNDAYFAVVGGNVGIGTKYPQAKLDVRGGAIGGIFQTDSNGYNLKLPSRNDINRGAYLFATTPTLTFDWNGNTIASCPESAQLLAWNNNYTTPVGLCVKFF